MSISDAALDEARKELNQHAFDNAKSRADDGSASWTESGRDKDVEVNVSPLGSLYGDNVPHRGVNIVPHTTTPTYRGSKSRCQSRWSSS